MIESSFIPKQPLTSIIDNTSDNKIVLSRILSHYSLNGAWNKRTRILDCTNFYLWTEPDYRAYDITRSHNIKNLKHKSFDIILFEVPQNKTAAVITIEFIKEFAELIRDQGAVIVKVKDYHMNNKLYGSYDIHVCFDSCGFVLADQIILKNPQSYMPAKTNNKIEIIHSYLMIFKKRLDS